MTKKIYSLPIVNNGEDFAMPNWTPKKHEDALDKMAKYCENLEGEEKKKAEDKEFKYFVVHETLQELDGEVTLEEVRNIHPIDLIELFNAVYNAGRTGIYSKDFRKGLKKALRNDLLKSTGKKSSKSSKKP